MLLYINHAHKITTRLPRRCLLHRKVTEFVFRGQCFYDIKAVGNRVFVCQQKVTYEARNTCKATSSDKKIELREKENAEVFGSELFLRGRSSIWHSSYGHLNILKYYDASRIRQAGKRWDKVILKILKNRNKQKGWKQIGSSGRFAGEMKQKVYQEQIFLQQHHPAFRRLKLIGLQSRRKPSRKQARPEETSHLSYMLTCNWDKVSSRSNSFRPNRLLLYLFFCLALFASFIFI